MNERSYVPPSFRAEQEPGTIVIQEPPKVGVFGREPVMYLALVQSALALGVGFGLNVTPEQIALILAFTSAVLGVVARQQVSPVTR